jgi:hypothetical protein
MLKYSETLELSWNIEPNRTELIKIIQMHQIHHVKSFKCNKTEFGWIETRKNIEILKKFGSREAMFNSVRFGRREKV